MKAAGAYTPEARPFIAPQYYGLRVGWLAGPRETIADLWRYKDYTTIGPGAISDRLAQVALTEPKRTAILERTREIGVRAALGATRFRLIRQPMRSCSNYAINWCRT